LLATEQVITVAKHYKELVVWQRAMDLVTEVYRATATFPDHEKFGLAAQLHRAAVSVPSNIAEGQGRLTPGEFKQFLGNARGSLFEVETQVMIAGNLGLIAERKRQNLHQLIDDVGRLLNGLIRSLSTRK
jgi:four helix bundle protein